MAYTDFLVTMYRGDDFTLTIAVTDDETDLPVNITGWSLRMTAKRALTDLDAAAVFALTSGGGGIAITAGTGGLATVAIPASGTSALTAAGDLLADVQGIDTGGKVTTLATGTITIILDVTQTAT